nr:hypothetical protein [Tanacetum cinerariifolium]
MVVFLSKSNASAGFDQIVDFLNRHVIQYALMVNPTIYVSCIKQFWVTVSVKKVNDVVKLRALINGKWVVVTKDVIRLDLRLGDADGVECLPNEEIFTELARMGYEKPLPKLTFYKPFFFAQCRKFNFSKYIFDSMVRNVDSPSKFLMYPWFLQVIINAQVDDLSSHTNQYISLALTQKVFANMRRIGKGFSGVETPLFATMIVQPPSHALEEEADVEVLVAHTPPLPTNAPSPPLIEPISPPPLEPISPPPQAQPAQSSPPQAVKEVKKGGKIEAIDADEEITLVEMKTQADLGAKLQGRKEDDNVTIKEASAAEPTVFDDEEVTMTMAQTLIKMKAKKARLLNEMAKRLHNEEIEQDAAREKHEKDDLEKAKVLQKQYVDKQENIDWNVVVEQMQEKHLDNIRKYQSLKRKPISIAQAKKNMIVYLKNMVGYKMEHFKGMTYDKVRPIFEREYNKVQTLFNPDKDKEPTKKRVAKETLLQESFKKLKAVKVAGSHSTQDTPTDDPNEISKEDVKNMLEIVSVSEFKVEALQVNTAVPTVDKEKALWVKLTRLFKPNAVDVFWKLQRYMHDPLTWKLYTNYGVHQVSSTRRHDIFMLTKKDYPLLDAVMNLMMSAKLQVYEDCKMAIDLVMKIFMEANKPKSRSLDTFSK